MAKMIKTARYRVLSMLSSVLLVLGGLTLVPNPSAKPDLLGYRTLCAFVPLSTLILLCLAGLGRLMRDALCGPGPRREEDRERPAPPRSDSSA